MGVLTKFTTMVFMSILTLNLDSDIDFSIDVDQITKYIFFPHIKALIEPKDFIEQL